MSSSGELKPFSHVVMLLVGHDGAGPHDLVRMSRQGRIYGEFADSQWYAETKRLESLGYLDSRKERGRTGPRTHYTLTDAGLEALRALLREPAPFSRIQMEPAWRLLCADLVGEEAVLASLGGLRQDIAELRAQIQVGEQVAPSLPRREKYLMLNHRLAHRIIDAHEAWLEEVEEALGGGEGGGDGS